MTTRNAWMAGTAVIMLVAAATVLRSGEGKSATDQDRIPAGKLIHPLHGCFTLRSKREWLRAVPEKRVVIVQRLLDLVVRRKSRPLR